MLSYLQKQIKYHIPNHTHFLIGLSGGVDSVVLLHLFAQLRQAQEIKLRAVHIHHGISQNADSWADFCQHYCEELDIPFTCLKVQLSGSQNLEAQAREARYQAIASHIQPTEILVTAHHLDDQAETLMLALKRGSGVKGLSGMQAVSFRENLAIFRPLLGVSKAEILTYAEEAKLQWIEDESNFNSDFDRNFLRNEILPALNQRWLFSQMLARTAQHCAEQQALLEELLQAELSDRIQGNSLSIAGFQDCSVAKQKQLIRLWLEKESCLMPSRVQLAEILNRVIQAKEDKNPQLVLGERILRRYQDRLYLTADFANTEGFSAILAPEDDIILPDNIGTIRRQFDQIIGIFPHKTDRLILPDELANQSLTLKLGQSGKVKIYGKAMREEIKKCYQQKGVPVWLRTRTPLVFIGEELVGLLS